MRVLLIRPNAKLKSTYIPLGIGYIADAVRKAGHEVNIIDARLERLSIEKLLEKVKEYSPDVVGLTALHKDLEREGVQATAAAFKSHGFQFPVVLGGPLVSTMGTELVGDGIVDVAVIGEGETTFNTYLDVLGRRDTPEGIPGIIFRHNGTVTVNPPGPYVSDIDDCKIAWDLIKPGRYFTLSGRSGMSIIKRSHRSVPIFTSRGCPFGCLYCHNIFGKKFRPRSPEAVLAEIAMLKKDYGIREIEIVDDCFNLDLNRAKAIVKGMIEAKMGLSISFPNGLRADRMDEELIDLLKEAGTYRIYYAVETATPRLQKLIHKNVDLERTEAVIAYTADRGIMTCGFFMLGFPTETEEEMRKTVDYALRSKLHQAYFFYVNPFPGTQLAEQYPVQEAEEGGIISMDYLDLKVNLSDVPTRELQRISKEAYLKFHFSPGRVWRTFKVVPKNFRTVWGAIIVGVLSLRDSTNF